MNSRGNQAIWVRLGNFRLFRAASRMVHLSGTHASSALPGQPNASFEVTAAQWVKRPETRSQAWRKVMQDIATTQNNSGPGDLSTDDPFPTEPSHLLSVVTITRYLIMYSAAIRLRYSRRKRPAANSSTLCRTGGRQHLHGDRRACHPIHCSIQTGTTACPIPIEKLSRTFGCEPTYCRSRGLSGGMGGPVLASARRADRGRKAR